MHADNAATPTLSPWLRRRVVADRVVAAVLGLLLLPVIAGLSLRVRREDGGPGTIRLSRVGRGGRRFALRKLRSMGATSIDGRAAGAPLTVAGDLRITRVGAALRRHRLDELPQLLNVVRGEMSLIGPRPETPEYVDLDDRRWTAVLQAPPGIAGPTQLLVEEWEAEALRGPNAHDVYRDQVLPVKLAVDAWYVAHASPRVDAVVVWSLVERFVLHRRITAVHRLAASAQLPAPPQPVAALRRGA